MRSSRILLCATLMAGCHTTPEPTDGEETRLIDSVDGGACPTPTNQGCPNALFPNHWGTLPTGGSKCSDYVATKTVFWGDLHDHSNYSLDSVGFMNQRSPQDAYDFARGKCQATNNPNASLGAPDQIDRPLDFVVVSDHSEYLGVVSECFKHGTLYDEQYCQSLRSDVDMGYPASNMLPQMAAIKCAEGDTACIVANETPIQSSPDMGPTTKQAQANLWQNEVALANANNIDCRFTTLPAYEWTANPGGATMHHIVVFANENVPAAPLDYLTYDSEQRMLAGLQQQCSGAAPDDMGNSCDVITIQHNSNISNGIAWNVDPADDAATLYPLREQYERMIEIHQNKGNSECIEDASDGDKSCNFETRGTGVAPEKAAQGYARYGLGQGLVTAATLGINAYQFGFVGATDNHQATPGFVKESTWTGSIAAADNTPLGRIKDDVSGQTMNPGGITGVWAHQLRRGDIFGALKAREAFATSGPRIAVRFYQTWDQTTNFCGDTNFPALLEADVAKKDGAVMGGVIPNTAPPSTPPRLIVWAQQDPAANGDDGKPVALAEIDIVKGAYTGGSTPVTTTYFKQQPLPAGTTSYCLDVKDSSAAKATQPLYYYPRVLQAPTKRWSNYDCTSSAKAAALCASDMGQRQGETQPIQERAWGSPIWLQP